MHRGGVWATNEGHILILVFVNTFNVLRNKILPAEAGERGNLIHPFGRQAAFRLARVHEVFKTSMPFGRSLVSFFPPRSS